MKKYSIYYFKLSKPANRQEYINGKLYFSLNLPIFSFQILYHCVYFACLFSKCVGYIMHYVSTHQCNSYRGCGSYLAKNYVSTHQCNSYRGCGSYLAKNYVSTHQCNSYRKGVAHIQLNIMLTHTNVTHIGGVAHTQLKIMCQHTNVIHIGVSLISR